jgi:RimJ/RimL family protein N-acetyltransferase
VIQTERLILRRWRDDDAAPFAALNDDPDVMAHFPARLSREESDAMVGRIRAHFDREGFGLWAVEVAGGAPFIGFTGLARPAWRPDVVEVGWRLARPHWGHGYATEAARAALAWGWANLPVDEIVAFVVPSNARSQAVMQRLGLVRDEAADFEHPRIPEGPLRHHWLFRIKRAAGS